MKKKFTGSAAAILCGFFYGIIPLIMLGLSRSGAVAGTVCSMYRLCFAGLITLPFSLGKLKRQPLAPKAFFNIFLVGAASGLTSVLLYEALARIPSGVGMAVHYTYPLITLLLAVVLFRQKVSRAALPAALLVLVGVALLCDLNVLPEKPAAGLLLALGSGVACSLYYMLFEHLDTGRSDPLVFSSFMNLSASFCMLFYNLANGTFTVRLTLSQWGILFLSGLIMAIAVVCITVAVRNVGTVMTTVLSTLEPIVCTVGSALLLKDPVSVRTLLGAALIIGAVVLVTVTAKGSGGENTEAQKG